MTRPVRALALALVLVLAGCTCPGAVKDNIEGEAAIHAGYTRLIEAALDGELVGEEEKNNVSPEDLDATPRAVLVLLDRAIRAVYMSKGSWYAIRFDACDGTDPAELQDELAPPTIPIPDPE
jgi:hypothetical protein